MRHHLCYPVLTVLLLALAAPARGQNAGDPGFAPISAEDLAWEPIQPPGFDAGMEIAVVRGDPAEAGQPYTIRLRLPDGYRFPPHWHPVAENVTVLEGRLLLALGETANESSLQSYQPGDYLYIDAKHSHHGGATGRTVVQLHGAGPFEIIVVGSTEDVG